MHKPLLLPRVLVVDDERVIADTLTLILNQRGFDARAVYSGEIAVDTATAFKPDVIIMDVMLGGINGIEAALRILGNQPDCRVILFSGATATADLLRDAEARGHRFDILPKPVHPADLLDRLNDSGFATGRIPNAGP